MALHENTKKESVSIFPVPSTSQGCVIARSAATKQSLKEQPILLRLLRFARNDTIAQSTIEFTFAMVVILFLIYGMVQVFRWAGMDLANRRVAHDSALTAVIPFGGDPSLQLNADFDRVLPMDAVYHGNITDGNTSQ